MSTELKRVADLGLVVGQPCYIEYHEPEEVNGERTMVPTIGAYWKDGPAGFGWGLFDGSGNPLHAAADVIVDPNWKIVEVGVKT